MQTSLPSVLLLTDSDVFAGTERHMLDLAQALRDLGQRVLIACPSIGMLAQRAADAGIEVFPVEKHGKLDVQAIRKIMGGLRAGRFDLIHTHNGRTSFLAALATLAAGRGRLVATQHFLAPAHTHLSGVKARISGGLHRWIAHRASRIVAISEAVSQSIKARGGADERKIVVVLNGINDPTGKGLTPRETMRAALGVPLDAPLIVTSARLEKEKGLEVLIRAMSRVIIQMPRARCIIAGEGKERAALERLIAAEGLAQTVTLVGFQSDVLSIVAAADVFALPSHAEPFGLALLEALALSVPAVAINAGAPPEILDGGKAGLLVAPNNDAEMAQAIQRLLQEPDFARELGLSGRRRFLECFTAREMALRMQRVYAANASQSL